MAQAIETSTPTLPLPTRPLPVVCRVGTGFVPAIYHGERSTEWLRWERFPRNTKLTGDEALAYASRVLWYRQTREAAKQRRLEALAPRYFLEAAE